MMMTIMMMMAMKIVTFVVWEDRIWTVVLRTEVMLWGRVVCTTTTSSTLRIRVGIKVDVVQRWERDATRFQVEVAQNQFQLGETVLERGTIFRSIFPTLEH